MEGTGLARRRVACWALLCVGVLLGACSRPEPPAPPPRAVKLWTVASASGPALLELAGEVRARTELRLGFQVSGRLLRREVEVGQNVRKGQLLAEIDAQDYALGARAAQAQVTAARTQRDLAAADAARFERLRAQNFISEAEWSRHQAALRAAQAQLDQAQAQAQAQQHQVGYARLEAPAAAVVLGVDAEPGQVVAAGAPVVRLAQDGPRDVVFAVPEDQVQSLRVGDTVQVALWSEQQQATVQAEVREVAAAADPAGRTFQVKAGLPAATRWPLGGTVRVRWERPGRDGQAAAGWWVPTTALLQQGEKTAVWRYDAAQGQVHAQPVELGGVEGDGVRVLSGLESGMQIVVAGVHVLSEGQVVRPYAGKSSSATPPSAP